MAKTQRTDLLPRANAILDAATELLLELGPRRLRIEEVANRAGVAKGTVYLHWKSREQLLLAVGAREAAAMLDAVIAAINTDPTEAAPHRYLRRHFLEATQRPVLKSIFIADAANLDALTDERQRTGVFKSKLITTRDYLTALSANGLLRSGQDLDDVDYGLQAIAYGFFAAAPLLPGGTERTLHDRADQLADVVRRSFEPTHPVTRDRYLAAAVAAIAAFTRLADEFRRLAYGSAAD